ncbi:hypothetical protein [Sphingomonas sp. 3-13AW]|uniref:hypothetical protein n=1 Tax=Sphingomonas sp. 3-13AW TaxID=3050450 RepID=UPI003BB642E8
MTDTPPPYARITSWPDLLATAQAILAQREKRYPQEVERGRMTSADAERGLRIARALVRQWQAVVDRADWYDAESDFAFGDGSTGAGEVELRTDLARASMIAAERAAANPGDERLKVFADHIAALAWHQRPFGAGQCPHIEGVHKLNQAARARADEFILESTNPDISWSAAA